MTPAFESGWEGLLKAATVQLTAPSGDVGTGFVVAPGLVATCAHVVAENAGELPDEVRGRVTALGRKLTLRPLQDSWVLDRDGGLDLVLLEIVKASDNPEDQLQPVLTSSVARIGDELWTYGHPLGRFHAGQSAILRYQGTDLRSHRPGAPWLPRAAGNVKGGCSGSGVINTRTGAVCGMLSTSDMSGSVHLVPVEEILARCPEGAEQAALNGAWPRTLTDSQLAAAGWRSPSGLLLEYLGVAADVADAAHPYPVIEGNPPSSLSIVYVRRYAGEAPPDEPTGNAEPDERSDAEDDHGETTEGSEKAPDDEGAARPASERIRAEELFELGEDILLVGAPGAGKSSLLRHAVTELAHRWTEDDAWRPGVVPIRLEAREFLASRTPLDIIADGVNGEGSAPSGVRWPADWFTKPPVPAARWLVLVDGLDEAGSVKERSRVLQKIKSLRADTRVGDHFRFLVATRPVNLQELSPDMRRFDLLPLDPAQLPDFAGGWFTALDLTDPPGAVRRFMDRLNSSGMAEPARTPLMAAMLCQLFAVDQDKPLPRGRTAVYREFVYQILDGGSWSRGNGLPPPVRDAVADRFGLPGALALDEVRGELSDMIKGLALARHQGEKGAAVEFLTRWSAGHRPPRMEERSWHELLGFALPELLRDCGLLVQRRSDFVFIHQTFAEYLTAERIAHDDRLTRTQFRDLFGHRPGWPEWALRLTGVAEPAATSVARFLIDAWAHRGQRGLRQALRLLARGQGGAMLISTLVDDGAQLDEDVRASARDVLHAAAELFDYEAAVALARMGDPRGVRLLADVVESEGVAHRRVDAARGLADLGDPRGVAALRRWSADTTARDCVEAAEELVRRGDPGGDDPLVRIVRDPAAAQRVWTDAARALLRLGLPGAEQALMSRMAHTRQSAAERLAAARQLIELGAPGVEEALAAMVRDRAGMGGRMDALEQLIALSDGSPTRTSTQYAAAATELLGLLARDPRLPPELVMAVASHVRDPDEREPMFRRVVEDPTAGGVLRLKALEQLPAHDDEHVTDILLPVLTDPRAPARDRYTAASRLPSELMQQTENRAALASLLKDPQLRHQERLALVQSLTSLPAADGRFEASQWWYDTVVTLVLDRRLPHAERRSFVRELRRLDARDRLASLALSPEVPGALRFAVAREAIAVVLGVGVSGEDARPGSAWAAVLLLGHLSVVFGAALWERATPGLRRLSIAALDFARALWLAVEACLYVLAQLPFVVLLAVLPFAVATAANAFAAACRAVTPPADWKLKVYFFLAALLVTAAYRGAIAFAETGRRGRKVLLWGLSLAIVLGLMRTPEVPGLNVMGDYLVTVIPWDGDLRT